MAAVSLHVGTREPPPLPRRRLRCGGANPDFREVMAAVRTPVAVVTALAEACPRELPAAPSHPFRWAPMG